METLQSGYVEHFCTDFMPDRTLHLDDFGTSAAEAPSNMSLMPSSGYFMSCLPIVLNFLDVIFISDPISDFFH